MRHDHRTFSAAARRACGRPRRERTHCPKGHAYDAANTYVYDTRRYCKTCAKQRSREQWQRQKEETRC
jgi:hypothetical protein